MLEPPINGMAHERPPVLDGRLEVEALDHSSPMEGNALDEEEEAAEDDRIDEEGGDDPTTAAATRAARPLLPNALAAVARARRARSDADPSVSEPLTALRSEPVAVPSSVAEVRPPAA